MFVFVSRGKSLAFGVLIPVQYDNKIDLLGV